MGHHTFDATRADRLEDGAARYQHLSSEELLWALNVDSTAVVADLGSGTGFYTDTVARDAKRVYGVDLQAEMHDYYRDKGVPENVELVTTDVADLPFDDGSLDAAFSTMTYHEFASTDALREVRRVMNPSGRVVIADWSATGRGESGPPTDERYSMDEAIEALANAGFATDFTAERPETFLLVAVSK